MQRAVRSSRAAVLRRAASTSRRQAKITVVRKDGRWFVSPVGTVLDLLDRYVSDVTQRQLYTMLGVPEQLPPDGTLTLGTAGDSSVTPREGAYVYALEAHRGERFLGLAHRRTARLRGLVQRRPRCSSTRRRATLLTQQRTRSSTARACEIPADGTYKVVVRPYGERPDVHDLGRGAGPEAAKHPPERGSYDGCEPTGNGGMTCSASASAPRRLSSSVIDAPTGECVTSRRLTTCTQLVVASSVELVEPVLSSSVGDASRRRHADDATSVPGG